MTRGSRGLGLALLTVVAAGCESRYAYLLEPERSLDNVVAEETRSWIGHRGGTSWIVVVAGEEIAREGGIAIAELDRDRSVRMRIGLYDYDGADRLGVEVTTRFDWQQEPDVAYIARRGSVRTDVFPSEIEQWRFIADGTRPVLVPPDAGFFEGVDLIDVAELFAALVVEEEEDEERETLLLRLLTVPLLLAQARIPDYGGLEVRRYVDPPPDPFSALIEGQVVLTVADFTVPNVTLRFTNAVELSRLPVNGTFVQDVNLAGNGSFQGGLSYALEDSAWTASVGLDGVELSAGRPSRGAFRLTAGGQRDVPATVINDLDLSAIYRVVP